MNGYKLRDYQIKAVDFLESVESPINGAQQRTGKGAMTSEWSKRRAIKRGYNKFNVVVPASLIFQWAEELKKWDIKDENILVFTSKLDKEERAEIIAKYHNNNKKIYFLIMSYEMYIKETEDLEAKIKLKLNNIKSDVVIFDEAHKLSNNKTKTYKILKKNLKFYKETHTLSGTIAQNKVEDLFNLLQIHDRSVFSSKWKFLEYWCDISEERVKRNLKIKKVVGVKEHLKPEFAKMLKQFTLSIKQKDVWDYVPHVVKRVTKIPLESKQLKMLNEIESKWELTLPSGEKKSYWTDTNNNLQLAMTYRQIISEPEIWKVNGAKTAWIEDYIENVNTEEKIIIFTTFAEYAKILNSKIKGSVLHIGETSFVNRNENLERFRNDPTCRVLIATIRSANVGLTLYQANVIIFADMDYNPAVMEQAEARIVAPDQAEEKYKKQLKEIFYLLGDVPLEQYIYDRLQEKKDVTHIVNNFKEFLIKLKEGK